MSCTYQIINPVGNLGEFYQVGSLYGWRKHPVTGELTFHRGIDIPAPTGTIVRSAQSGIVTLAQNVTTAGNMVKVDNPNTGLLTKYMHLNSILVNKGDTVKAGDPIGTVGATGRVTGAHLHFEMYQDGQSFDPIECYQSSEHNNPYGHDLKKFNFIPFIVGGGVILTTLLIYHYKNKK